jgi:pimeloyl-ACP methyl ester carboxylesterase
MTMIVAAAALSVSCDPDPSSDRATGTVSSAEATATVTLPDPRFNAISGANAYYGQVNGGVYQIEIPDDWNGDLVLYLRGGDVTGFEINQPRLRRFLIQNGYAWATTSYDRPGELVDAAADQIAALWDFFVDHHGEPSRTILFGQSMGGGGALMAAERYPDRFDGALIECGVGGERLTRENDLNVLVVGAIAAGLDANEVASEPVEDVIVDRIIPAFGDPSVADRFEALWKAISGGERPFAIDGLSWKISILWGVAIRGTSTGFSGNENVTYELAPNPAMDSRAFNEAAPRFKTTVPFEPRQFTGDIRIPVLSLHTTGDARVTLHEQQEVRRLVESKGRGELLVQRTVQDPEHCGAIRDEREQAFRDLVEWLDSGRAAAGENLLADDLSALGAQFTLKQRLGSAEAESVSTASQRLSMNGNVVLDGEPYTGSRLFFNVQSPSGIAECSYGGPEILDGRYRRVVAPATESPGCGEVGSLITPVLQLDDYTLVRAESVPWPTSSQLVLDVRFDSADRAPLTLVSGEVLDAAGDRVLDVGRIDGYEGDVHCATGSIPRFGTHTGYVLVVDAEAKPDCREPRTWRFEVNGEPATPSHDTNGTVQLHLSSAN